VATRPRLALVVAEPFNVGVLLEQVDQAMAPPAM
jgi:hypothetical protein